MVGRPSWIVESCQDAHPEGQKWLGGPSGGQGVVGRPYRRARSGWEALAEGQEWSGGPPVVPGMVGRPSQKVGRSQEPTQMVRRPY